MSDKWTKNSMQDNLVCIKDVIENISFDFSFYDLVIVVGVHSHFDLNNYWKNIDQKKIFLSVPCCGGFNHRVDREADFEFHENGIFSKMNTIIIWSQY